MTLPVYLTSMLSIVLLIVSVYYFSYSTKRIFGKSFPWYVNILGGALCAPFIVPVALVCYVLELLGFHYRFK